MKDLLTNLLTAAQIMIARKWKGQAEYKMEECMVMGDPPGLPCRPSSPCRQEPALKRGWLKKQRSIMKNWQQRWFVLRGDQLLYYKNEDEVKPQVRCLWVQSWPTLGLRRSSRFIGQGSRRTASGSCGQHD
uniref:PH domain-containing protein n=1 Tax=Podarcis muralis TaxID=64176 RepID=A0A670I2F1_PODMU